MVSKEQSEAISRALEEAIEDFEDPSHSALQQHASTDTGCSAHMDRAGERIFMDAGSGGARNAQGESVNVSLDGHATQFTSPEDDTSRLIEEDARYGDYDHKPDRLETITHAVLFFMALGVVLAFTHWNHVSVLLSMGTLLLVSMITMYNLFMRRTEHKAVQTLLVVWVLWLLYGVLVFGYQYTIDSWWVYAARDTVLTVQVMLLVGFRMLPPSVQSVELGTRIIERVAPVVGPHRVERLHRTLEHVRTTVTETAPRRMRSLDDGASIRAAQVLNKDCLGMAREFRNNAGVRLLSSDSRFGFLLFQLLLVLPFVQNNAVVYNPYWTVTRLVLSYILYKLVDDVYRPRMIGGQPKPSATTIITITQYPLYADPYLALGFGVALVVVFSCVCKNVREQRRAEERASTASADLDQFSDAESAAV